MAFQEKFFALAEDSCTGAGFPFKCWGELGWEVWRLLHEFQAACSCCSNAQYWRKFSEKLWVISYIWCLLNCLWSFGCLRKSKHAEWMKTDRRHTLVDRLGANRYCWWVRTRFPSMPYGCLPAMIGQLYLERFCCADRKSVLQMSYTNRSLTHRFVFIWYMSVKWKSSKMTRKESIFVYRQLECPLSL